MRNYKQEITQMLFHLDCEVTVMNDGYLTAVAVKTKSRLMDDDMNIIRQRISQEFPEAMNITWLQYVTKIYEVSAIGGPDKFLDQELSYSLTFEVSNETP